MSGHLSTRPGTILELPHHPWDQRVRVLLDGEPVEGAMVMQGGTLTHERSDAQGEAIVRFDPWVLGDIVAVASVPNARIGGTDVMPQQDVVVVELYRLPEVDNPDYVFKDPGTPARNEHNGYCSHCHVRQVADWVDHPHALAASNPVVHDVYAGTASVLGPQDCVAAGGVMQSTRQPGGGTHDVCMLGDGTLPDLNPTCGAPCDVPEETGACADCHAPGIDGELGAEICWRPPASPASTGCTAMSATRCKTSTSRRRRGSRGVSSCSARPWCLEKRTPTSP